MNTFKPGIFVAWIPALLMLLATVTILGEEITLHWDSANPAEDVAGYNVYVIGEDGAHDPINVGLVNNTAIDLDNASPHLIFVTAYDSKGHESDASDVLNYPPGAPCLIDATPTGADLTSFRSTDSFFITTPANCAFVANTDDSWITITGTGTFGGRTRVDYVVSSNRKPFERSGFISTGGQSFSIHQDSGGPTPPLLIKELSAISTIDEGTTLQLSVEAERDEDQLTYQWLKDGILIPGATGLVYSRASTGPADAGTYSVEVENSVGTTQEQTEVVVYRKPYFLSNDSHLTFVELGTQLSLQAFAAGSDLRYTWFRNGAPATNVLPAADDFSAVVISSVTPEDLGRYDVIVSNRLGTIQSQIAFLTTREFEQQIGRIHLTLDPAGTLQVEGEGIPGQSYDIQISNDLIQWRFFDSVTVSGEGFFTIASSSPASDPSARWFVRTVRRDSTD